MLRQFNHAVGLLLSLALCPAALADEAIDFNRDIRPILAKHCFACHGQDEQARQADLRLDTADGATADLDGRRAVAPGKPAESELIARINSTDPDVVMPPPDTDHALTEREKELLASWIREGAAYALHWSFVPPSKHDPPKVQRDDWARAPLDYFVLARLESKGLSPAPPADRYRLLRRLSLDLTGLPPTPAEADAFAADTRADAYERVVDRLLNSDAYGEHWARMWLDLARYADTKGYEKDLPRDMWQYREWVIRALNEDMPFDQFTIKQLAGDLLPDATEQDRLATAFHRNTMTNDEGGTDNEEFRVAAVKDRVDTTGQVWLGLTLGCAKCHSHKYDPISQAEYYSFYAFFNQTEDADRSDDAPVLRIGTDEQQSRIATLQEKEAAALKRQKQLAATLRPPLEDQEEVKSAKAHSDKLAKDLADIRKQLKAARDQVAKTPVMRELPANKRRSTKIHQRGNFLDPGEEVSPEVPQMFGKWPAGAPRNRLGVARWLLQPENPLTARVMVNRVWARLFGAGFVETEEDFGTQGSAPTHPTLLDYLAVDFRENGWSLKQLLRGIVLSATYRQSAKVTDNKLAKDPRNRWLSRGARFRLPAETVRDQALAASGLLTRNIGGPSVMPPQPAGIWKSTYNTRQWIDATGPDRYRRALYTYWKRTSPYPAMLTFDAGSGEVCQIRRVRTNTPLQALVTLNDPAFVEAAGALANQMHHHQGDLRERLAFGFRRVLIRPPTEQELNRLQAVYKSLSADFGEAPAAAKQLCKAAAVDHQDAALVAVGNVLLNLDETLMRP